MHNPCLASFILASMPLCPAELNGYLLPSPKAQEAWPLRIESWGHLIRQGPIGLAWHRGSNPLQNMCQLAQAIGLPPKTSPPGCWDARLPTSYVDVDHCRAYSHLPSCHAPGVAILNVRHLRDALSQGHAVPVTTSCLTYHSMISHSRYTYNS